MDELVKMVVQPESPKTWLGRLWTRWWAISRENCRLPLPANLTALSPGAEALERWEIWPRRPEDCWAANS